MLFTINDILINLVFKYMAVGMQDDEDDNGVEYYD